MASGKELVHLIDRKVFQPILNAWPEDYSRHDRTILRELQAEARRQRARYRKYDSPDDVRNQFLDDLSSDAGQRTSDQLRELDLPTLESVRDEVLRAAGSDGT